MDALAEEARTILTDISAEHVRVEKDAQGYLVSASFVAEGFDGQPHAGHTAIDPLTSADPRDMARRLIAISRSQADRNASRKSPVAEVEPAVAASDAYDGPDAVMTEEPTFAPEVDPFGPPPAAAEGAGRSEEEQSEPLDADFTEDEPAFVEGSELELPELEAPGLGEDVLAAEEEAQGSQDHFYGLDDLDRVKRLRIGDVATYAAELEALTEAAVNELEGEHAALTAFVVTNLDKHTGAFTLQDAASIASYRRWTDLETAHQKLQAIDRERKAKTAYLLTTDLTREEVVSFDYTAGWP